MQGRPMEGLFDMCHWVKTPPSTNTSITETLLRWWQPLEASLTTLSIKQWSWCRQLIASLTTASISQTLSSINQTLSSWWGQLASLTTASIKQTLSSWWGQLASLTTASISQTLSSMNQTLSSGWRQLASLTTASISQTRSSINQTRSSINQTLSSWWGRLTLSLTTASIKQIPSSLRRLLAAAFTNAKAILSSWWNPPASPSNGASQCWNFNIKPLTIGQVASASSAAAGGGAVQTWVENVIELVRRKTQDLPLRCTVLPHLLQEFVTPCNRELVVEQTMKLLGCKSYNGTTQKTETEDIASVAKQLSAYLQKMAIEMNIETPSGEHTGHTAIDAVSRTPSDMFTHCYSNDTETIHPLYTYACPHTAYTCPLQTSSSVTCHFRCSCVQGYNDNSGFGPIIARYLDGEPNTGQILALVINELGDHQMETYFHTNDNSGGMMCEGEASMEGVFKTIKKHHEKSFQDINGTHIPRDEDEKTCAIRLPPTVFFKVLLVRVRLW